MTTCDRCKAETKVLRMSFFNTEMCCEACLKHESKHPDYKKAKRIELEEVRKGNYNFVGIGKPYDL